MILNRYPNWSRNMYVLKEKERMDLKSVFVLLMSAFQLGI